MSTCQKNLRHPILINCFIVVTTGALSIFSGERGRAFIRDNTIVSDAGSRLRGGTFWIFGSTALSYKTTYALSSAPWEEIRRYNFNAMRVACGYRPQNDDNYSLDKYDEILDSLFFLSDQNGVYLIIDFHDTPGTYSMETAREFWTRYSKRYKDKKNALFELTNEPKFDQLASYSSGNLRDFEELWNICNDNAPQIPIIILSYCQVGYSGATPAEVADSLHGIDWLKAAVGFHSYWRDSSVRIVDLKNWYPCINTEFICLTEDNKTMKFMNGYDYHGTRMKKLEISWLQWEILEIENSITNHGDQSQKRSFVRLKKYSS